MIGNNNAKHKNAKFTKKEKESIFVGKTRQSEAKKALQKGLWK